MYEVIAALVPLTASIQKRGNLTGTIQVPGVPSHSPNSSANDAEQDKKKMGDAPPAVQQAFNEIKVITPP